MLSDDAVEKIAEVTAKKTVDDVFLRLGIDVTKPEAVVSMQKDFVHLRDSREGKELLVQRGKLAVIGVFVTTVLAIVLKGIGPWLADLVKVSN